MRLARRRTTWSSGVLTPLHNATIGRLPYRSTERSESLKLNIIINGTPYEVEVEAAEELSDQELWSPAGEMIQSSVLPSVAKLGGLSDVDERKLCRSPLAGVVARLYTSPGQHVRTNEILLILDAMKMEIKINAHAAGTIKSIEVAPGEAVKPDQILVRFE